jgi:hypothetical protein
MKQQPNQVKFGTDIMENFITELRERMTLPKDFEIGINPDTDMETLLSPDLTYTENGWIILGKQTQSLKNPKGFVTVKYPLQYVSTQSGGRFQAIEALANGMSLNIRREAITATAEVAEGLREHYCMAAFVFHCVTEETKQAIDEVSKLTKEAAKAVENFLEKEQQAG